MKPVGWMPMGCDGGGFLTFRKGRGHGAPDAPRRPDRIFHRLEAVPLRGQLPLQQPHGPGANTLAAGPPWVTMGDSAFSNS